MSGTKRCCVCLRRQPVQQFVKNPHCKGGYAPNCRRCRRRLLSMNLRIVKRAWHQPKELRTTSEALYKRAAQAAVQFCVHQRWILRPKKCSACQTECQVEAHHHDYAKPLDVEWLCRKCHRNRHPRIGDSAWTGS